MLSVVAAVVADLSYCGLPVVDAGDSSAGAVVPRSTYAVFYDPTAGVSGGTFVTWRSPEHILVAAREMDMRAVRVGGVVLEAMLVAVQAALTGMGWIVSMDDVGVHESSVRVRAAATGSGR